MVLVPASGFISDIRIARQQSQQCIDRKILGSLRGEAVLQKEEELARQRLIAQQTNERLASQKLINLELKERLNMLERLDYLTFRRESACLVKFQQLHLKETY